jgi:2-methylisocitrate lyase-like PEP mutase family enzyme
MLTCEAITDLQAWQSFIETFNGKLVFLADNSVTSDHLKLFTDASLDSLGYAAVFGSLWFTKACPSHLQHYKIAVKELSPIVLALQIWGDSLKN